MNSRTTNSSSSLWGPLNWAQSMFAAKRQANKQTSKHACAIHGLNCATLQPKGATNKCSLDLCSGLRLHCPHRHLWLGSLSWPLDKLAGRSSRGRGGRGERQEEPAKRKRAREPSSPPLLLWDSLILLAFLRPSPGLPGTPPANLSLGLHFRKSYKVFNMAL